MKTREEIEARVAYLQGRVQELRRLRSGTEGTEWNALNSRMATFIHKIQTLKWVLGEEE